MKNALTHSVNKNKNIIFILCSLLIANYLKHNFQKPKIMITKQESSLNFDNDFLIFFSLGQKRLISSLLWVKTLMDSDLEHHKQKDLNSWMFLRFKTISLLDPMFYENYLFGGQYLSVVKDDLKGAAIIYGKGIKNFPDDFWLLFYSGIHYLAEMKDIKSAKKYLNKIKFHPIATKRVPYLPSLVAKLDAKEGALGNAFHILTIAYRNAPKNSKLSQKYYDSLYALKTEIDLACLNQEGKKCEKLDLDKNQYLYINGKWIAQKKWLPFRYNK